MGGNGTVRMKASFPLTHLANEGMTSRGDTAPGARQGATWTSGLHVDVQGSCCNVATASQRQQAFCPSLQRDAQGRGSSNTSDLGWHKALG